MCAWKDPGLSPFHAERLTERTKWKVRIKKLQTMLLLWMDFSSAKLAVAMGAIQTYRHSFYCKKGFIIECLVMFLKCIFTSIQSIKSKVVFCRELRGAFQQRPFLSQITTSFPLMFGKRSLQDLLLSVINILSSFSIPKSKYLSRCMSMLLKH